jgi:tetratricopeptide (TPR) repeat protein
LLLQLELGLGAMRRLYICAFALLLWFSAAGVAASRQPPETAVCDATADYFLGTEDYPQAIRLHLAVLKREPSDALAHYHLGFAYGMVGRTSDEIQQYQQAAALGLRLFDLFLNLGLARFDAGDLIGATAALRTASSLTGRPEPHFDLGLIYERRGMFREAESAIRRALALAPNQPDYLNMLAVVAAEQGDFSRARDIWTSIIARDPFYQAAAANLRVSRAVRTATAAQEATVAQASGPVR